MIVSGSCCAKPIAKIIKVGDIQTGIIGLDNVLRNVYISGIEHEEELKRELLAWVKEFGNYITPSREEDYKHALLREYRKFHDAIEQEAKAQERVEKAKQKKGRFKLF